MSLSISNLSVSVDAKEVIRNLSFTLEKGTVHAIMGPNGSGKSTLANAIMGHPKYAVTGSVQLDGQNISDLGPDKKSKAGLFLSMQYPSEISGVTLTNFLRVAVESKMGKKQNPIVFYKYLQEKMKELGMDPEFAGRSVNLGFSGGEKKRTEILQLSVLEPTYAILDETDSGLDVDALKIVAEGINRFCSPERGILLITHYNRILKWIKPDRVHIMHEGKIIKSGTSSLSTAIEKSGYGKYIKV